MSGQNRTTIRHHQTRWDEKAQHGPGGVHTQVTAVSVRLGPLEDGVRLYPTGVLIGPTASGVRMLPTAVLVGGVPVGAGGGAGDILSNPSSDEDNVIQPINDSIALTIMATGGMTKPVFRVLDESEKTILGVLPQNAIQLGDPDGPAPDDQLIHDEDFEGGNIPGGEVTVVDDDFDADPVMETYHDEAFDGPAGPIDMLESVWEQGWDSGNVIELDGSGNAVFTDWNESMGSQGSSSVRINSRNQTVEFTFNSVSDAQAYIHILLRMSWGSSPWDALRFEWSDGQFRVFDVAQASDIIGWTPLALVQGDRVRISHLLEDLRVEKWNTSTEEWDTVGSEISSAGHWEGGWAGLALSKNISISAIKFDFMDFSLQDPWQKIGFAEAPLVLDGEGNAMGAWNDGSASFVRCPGDAQTFEVTFSQIGTSPLYFFLQDEDSSEVGFDTYLLYTDGEFRAVFLLDESTNYEPMPISGFEPIELQPGDKLRASIYHESGQWRIKLERFDSDPGVLDWETLQWDEEDYIVVDGKPGNTDVGLFIESTDWKLSHAVVRSVAGAEILGSPWIRPVSFTDGLRKSGTGFSYASAEGMVGSVLNVGSGNQVVQFTIADTSQQVLGIFRMPDPTSGTPDFYAFSWEAGEFSFMRVEGAPLAPLIPATPLVLDVGDQIEVRVVDETVTVSKWDGDAFGVVASSEGVDDNKNAPYAGLAVNTSVAEVTTFDDAAILRAFLPESIGSLGIGKMPDPAYSLDVTSPIRAPGLRIEKDSITFFDVEAEGITAKVGYAIEEAPFEFSEDFDGLSFGTLSGHFPVWNSVSGFPEWQILNDRLEADESTAVGGIDIGSPEQSVEFQFKDGTIDTLGFVFRQGDRTMPTGVSGLYVRRTFGGSWVLTVMLNNTLQGTSSQSAPLNTNDWIYSRVFEFEGQTRIEIYRKGEFDSDYPPTPEVVFTDTATFHREQEHFLLIGTSDSGSGPIGIDNLTVKSEGGPMLTPVGKLGVGKDPEAMLDVAGEGNFDGELTASNLSGTNTGDQTAATLPADDPTGLGGDNTQQVLENVYNNISAELGDLDDVTVSNPADGQALLFNSGTGQWTNQEVQAFAKAGTYVNGNNITVVDTAPFNVKTCEWIVSITGVVDTESYAACKVFATQRGVFPHEVSFTEYAVIGAGIDFVANVVMSGAFMQLQIENQTPDQIHVNVVRVDIEKLQE